MEIYVVCPSCRTGNEIPMDMDTDRPQKGQSCRMCQSKIT